MKTLILTLLCASILGITALVPVMAEESKYVDVPADSWFFEAAEYTAERGLFTGVGEKTFAPNKMTRGMFVTVLGRIANVEEHDGINQTEHSFSDVKSDIYYAPYVSWASQNGIVNGVSEDLFAPETEISREQMCTILIRYLKDYLKYDLSAYTDTEIDFIDSASVSSWAKAEVEVSQAMGLIKGVDSAEGVTFLPQNPVSRAAAAEVFMRLDKFLTRGGVTDDPQDKEEPSEPDLPNGGGSAEDPKPPAYSEEEIAEEKQISEYLLSICSNYRESAYVNTVDQEVRECMNLLISCMEDALAYRQNGGFLSDEYVRKNYANEISDFKSMYRNLTEEQVIQIQNLVIRLEKEENIYMVLDYFGVAVAAL